MVHSRPSGVTDDVVVGVPIVADHGDPDAIGQALRQAVGISVDGVCYGSDPDGTFSDNHVPC